MKKILVLILILAAVCTLDGCRFFKGKPEAPVPNIAKKELTDRELIDVALEAEKRFYRVVYSGNPDKLKEYKLDPVSPEIKSLQDVGAIMNPYWETIIFRKLWQMGSEAMPDLPFGFYNDDFSDLGLLDAKNIRVVRKSRIKVLVVGDVVVSENMLTGAYRYSPEVTLRWTTSGWKAWNGLGE